MIGHDVDPGREVPALQADEGEVLAALDLLLTGRGRMPDAPFELAAARPLLVRVVCRRLAVHAVRVLVEGGGVRTRTVLREGRRVTGRVFDDELVRPLQLVYGPATWTLLQGVCTRLVPLGRGGRASREARASVSPPARRVVRAVVPKRAITAGDQLVYALSSGNTAGLGLGGETERDLRRRLSAGSPLAMLMRLDGFARTEGQAEAFASLLAPDLVPLLEHLEERIVEGWRHEVAAAMTPARSPDAFVRRWQEIAHTFCVWIDALDAAGRFDLLRPIQRLLAALPADTALNQDGALLHITRLVRAGSVGERNEAREAVADVTALGGRMEALRARMAEEAYGDARYEESQLVLADYDEHFARHVGPLRALTHELTGTIG